MAFAKDLEQAWYSRRWWPFFLWPLTALYLFLSFLRRCYFRTLGKPKPLPVPVVVVGNISVGGTGKTPLIIALVKHLQARGRKPGVVSRGYGGKPPQWPFLVEGHSLAEHSGDEPLLISRACACPVAVDPNRYRAALLLVEQGVDIILSDDGLQHYALPRQFEIAVIDGKRGFGNGQCLPTGPLREGTGRLNRVDWCVLNGGELALNRPSIRMQLQPSHWQRLSDGEIIALDQLQAPGPVKAIAGIGHPQRFFNTLVQLGVDHEGHAYPDHHPYSVADLDVDATVLMTEKDAVKCAPLIPQLPEAQRQRLFALAVSAELPEEWLNEFFEKISKV